MAIIKYKNPDYSEGKPKYLPLNIPYYSSDVYIGSVTPNDGYKVWINSDTGLIKYSCDGKWLEVGNSLLEDVLSYGIEWDVTVADPECTRIGNLELHRTLPIQSQLKGCIYKNNKVVYWLNPNDWNLKPESTPSNIISITNSDTNKLVVISKNDADKGNAKVNMRVKFGVEQYGTIKAVDTVETGIQLTIKLDSVLSDTPSTITLGSVLNGDDGDVCVHVPRFYGRSWEDGDKRRVKISLHKIDNTWVEIPEAYMFAYRLTIDSNTGKARSVVSTEANLRGGGNRSSYDQYIDNDPFRSDLNKPRTAITRSTVRTACSKGDSVPLDYFYYKWVFYWLVSIEFCTFNIQSAYNSSLTSEGFHQGGLGPGVTEVSSTNWSIYNGYYPLTPCGFCNSLGNFTGVKESGVITCEITTSNSTNITGYSKDTAGGTTTNSGTNVIITKVSKLNTRILYCNWNVHSGTVVYNISGLSEGQSIIFYTNGGIVATASNDGEISVPWGTSQSERQIRGGVVGDCSITISIISVEQIISTLTLGNLKVPRWRGFDNPFGDIFTILDGIVLKRDAANQPSKVWVTNDPNYFDDNTYNKKLAGIEVASDGYIKEFALGTTAEIIPSAVGGGGTTYKCDYHYCNASSTSFRLLRVGGVADCGSSAGLGCFYSYYGVGLSYAYFGFRALFRPSRSLV